MIENGLRSEGIPGVFQATRVVLYAKAALPGVMGSTPFGYRNWRALLKKWNAQDKEKKSGKTSNFAYMGRNDDLYNDDLFDDVSTLEV